VVLRLLQIEFFRNLLGLVARASGMVLSKPCLSIT
jgi:hypothetical protein